MSEKLAPCPFCGEAAEIEYWGPFCWPRCSNRGGCGAVFSLKSYDNVPAAIAAWNRRSEPPRREAEIEQLKAHLDESNRQLGLMREAYESAEKCAKMQTDAYQNAMANAERLHEELKALQGAGPCKVCGDPHSDHVHAVCYTLRQQLAASEAKLADLQQRYDIDFKGWQKRAGELMEERNAAEFKVKEMRERREAEQRVRCEGCAAKDNVLKIGIMFALEQMRMRDNWAESDEATRKELWRNLHNEGERFWKAMGDLRGHHPAAPPSVEVPPVQEPPVPGSLDTDLEWVRKDRDRWQQACNENTARLRVVKAALEKAHAQCCPTYDDASGGGCYISDALTGPPTAPSDAKAQEKKP